MLSYEDVRAKNLEDNKAILEKLMEDIKWHPKLKKIIPRTKQSTPIYKHRKSDTFGPIRRNPSRKARVNGKIDSRNSRRHSDPVLDSDTSPTNRLQVRFGFFKKSSSLDTEKDSDEDYNEDAEDIEEKLPKANYMKTHQIDTRSAEEITEDDLALVAEHVKEKRYDSITGSSCHQCRQKTSDMKTICRSGFCFGIRGQFCGPCLRNRYGENAKEALKNENWNCPPCRGICNCSFCRKKQGKSCTGIMIHMARMNGFDSVKDYLQSLSKKI